MEYGVLFQKTESKRDLLQGFDREVGVIYLAINRGADMAV